ncbi:MAG: sigma 54-interacting transcriptional regulator [Clostridiales Family XIII bacterium]|jgi:transcriptional regulator with PAS, ATPase and Fis domain|nr:sigma 54-interacting transcriptional regulator [Clostridiales Family XIII bacterium]
MQNNYKKEYLQYAFFIGSSEELFPCDEGTRKFLGGVNRDAVLTHLLSLRFLSSVTDSTVILGGTSYNLRLTTLPRGFFAPFLAGFSPEYLVTMHNQAHIASIIRELKSVQYRPESFSELFEDIPNPMFVDDADGNILYLNKEYEKFSGIAYDRMVGQKLSDFAGMGVLQPTISPTILLSKNEITVIQTISGKKNMVISGFPIYNDTGEPFLILTCANRISGMTDLSKADVSETNLGEQFANEVGGGDASSISVIAESDAMRTVLNDSVAIAQYPVPVLITGESGTGKEIIANVIHASSRWRNRPFVKINCSAISPSLFESELFGYEGGAFTSASAKGKPGLLETADGGTLMLDEVGDMPIETQAKVLRVLQSGEFYHVGGTKLIRVNVRVIASTNKDLIGMTRSGRFRSDLFFRLNTISINIPPLRERAADVEPLIRHYTYMCNKLYGTNKDFSPELIELARGYAWPGNVRELENIVKRLVITCTEDVLTPENFYSKYGAEYDMSVNAISDTQAPRVPATGGPISMKSLVESYERILIESALTRAGNTRAAARLLGISQATLLRKRSGIT